MNIFKELKCKHEKFLLSRWIENNLTYKGKSIVLSQGQKDIINDNTNKKCFLCKRRFGKSFVIVLLAIVKAIRSNNNDFFAIISPNASSSNIKSYLLHEIISENECLNKHIRSMSKDNICLKNGSTIRFYGANSESVKGIYADHYYIDDFEFMTQEYINYLIGKINFNNESECLFLSTSNNHYMDVTQYIN